MKWYLGALVIGILGAIVGAILKGRQQSDLSAEWIREAAYPKDGY